MAEQRHAPSAQRSAVIEEGKGQGSDGGAESGAGGHVVEPTFLVDGSPSAETLKQIEEWDDDWFALMNFLEHCWSANGLFDIDTKDRPTIRYELSTGGFSTNEALIEALQENRQFWLNFWFSMQRGGHYVFLIPKPDQTSKGQMKL